MYVPPYYKLQDDQAVTKLTSENPFATLTTSSDNNQLSQTLVPILLDPNNPKTIYFHLARSNPHCEAITSANANSILTITGPNCYISPNYYQSTDLVPTWNFLAVQYRGVVEVLDREGTLKVVDDLSERHERDFPKPWTSGKLPERKLKLMLASIVGYKFTVESKIAKAKLSQNRELHDFGHMINQLEARGKQPEKQVAAWMRQQSPFDEVAKMPKKSSRLFGWTLIFVVIGGILALSQSDWVIGGRLKDLQGLEGGQN